MTLKSIERHLRSGKADAEFLEECRADKRTGVARTVELWERRLERANAEEKRLAALYARELALQQATRVVGGVDEAGRGPLAGPVIAACVVLPPEPRLAGIDDSKTIAPARREALAARIHEVAEGIGVGAASVEEIDRLNILGATLEAARRAVHACRPRRPDTLLLDAITIPGISQRQEGIIRGDATVACIAAASIVAKVTRDKLMLELDERHPGYGFARHKGYGTADHMAAIQKLGPSPVHRRSFLHLTQEDPVALFVRLQQAFRSAATLEALREAAEGIPCVSGTLGRARVLLLRREYRQRRDALATVRQTVDAGGHPGDLAGD